VGGEIYFEPCYEGNPLVNAMAVGLVKHDKIARSAAKGVGNLVVYVGAKTGRDGIHGTTFASVEISDESAQMRSAIQVGDPFYQKLLLEATLEVINAGLVVGIQDMGAAGLTCSSSEMAGKGEVGIQMHTDRVPQREAGMTPYEIMLSESQERMLVIVEPQDFPKVEAIFHKWDLEAVVVGEVIEEQVLRIVHDGVVEAEIPPEYLILGGKAPVYTRETKEPEYFQRLKNAELPKADSSLDPGKELLAMLAHENLCSRAKVYQQYDHMVQISTVVEPGSDAAVVAIKGTDKAIALCTDCNSRYCYLDPYEGTRAAVAESALNVAVSGAKPLAISNCLNFGNPYKPEIYWGFSQAIKGMGDACRALDTPVTGGNVSLYNENPESAVYPTPVIGMLGLLEDMKLALTQFFKSEGDQIMLIGNLPEDLGASQYLEFRHNMVAGRVPKLDIDAHKRLIDLLQELSSQKLLKSAHDVADGGLGVALAECLFDNTDLGAKVTLPQADNPILSLFGEVQSTVIISFKPSNLETVKKLVQQSGLQHWMLGEVTSNGTLKIESILELSTQELYDTWRDALQLK